MGNFDQAALFGTAVVAGAVNSVVGGGGFLTFPALLASGLSPLQACACNTALLTPGMGAVLGLRAKDVEGGSRLLPGLLGVTLAGAALGAWLLVLTPNEVFRREMPWLFLAATLVFAFGRAFTALLQARAAIQVKVHMSTLAWCLLFLIGVYGGFFGTGAGMMLMALLSLAGFTDLPSVRGLKILLTTAIGVAALILFSRAGLVQWPIVALMMTGSAVGGCLGVLLFRQTYPDTLRVSLAALGSVVTGYLLFNR